MKILIASDLHYPTINGVATFSRNLARGLAERGFEVLVIAPSQTGKKCQEIDGNYVISRTTAIALPFYQNLRISINPAHEVKKIIEDFHPDVIHIQTPLQICQAVMRYGNKKGIPVVSTNHGMPENIIDNIRLLAPLSRPVTYMLNTIGARFHAKANYVTLPTKSAIDMFRATEKITAPLEAVSNGINLAQFTAGTAPAELYKKFGIPKSAPIVSYVGRLDAEKHLPVLLQAFVKVRKQVPNAHLLIVGDGTELGPLGLLAKKLGVGEHVTLTGRVSDEELVALHKVGTVFCMPSPAELQSIATLEAMASGQPVVAVDAGALRELCQDGRNGYLCKQDDATGIAKRVVEILKDKKLRDTFSTESLAIARTHDIQTTLDRFESIYRSLAKT